MTTEYLLDTNACISIRQLLAGQAPKSPQKQRALQALQARWQAVQASALAMSLTTLGELQYGVAKSGRAEAQQQLDALLQQIAVLLPNHDGALHYGHIRAQLETQGQTIGPNDLWIAAHGRATARTVVTNNTGEYSRVAGLAVDDWTR